MLDPHLIAGTPFKSRTAFEDLVGTVAGMHSILIDATTRLTGSAPARYVLDSAAPTAELLESIQAQNSSLARILGIGPPPDLQSFNLRDATDFASFTFLLSQDLTRLRDAAGVI